MISFGGEAEQIDDMNAKPTGCETKMPGKKEQKEEIEWLVLN